MPSKEILAPSNILITSTVFVAVIGAFHVNKKYQNKMKTVVSIPRVMLASLFSLSFLSFSEVGAFAPSHDKISSPQEDRSQTQTTKTVFACSPTGSSDETPGPNTLSLSTKQADGRVDKPDESLLQSITMQPIGQISSVYRLCVGTPRQGLLAPNSRGRIDLFPDRIASDSILDLDKFSHCWVVFIFHLNTNAKSVEKSKQSLKNGKVVQTQFPSKIKPPALGGKRVGIFATRSPHRPNPIGFSLCKVDKIVIPKKKKHKKAGKTPYHVYVSGLDLVDGTPVLDIKPYVPHYDSVGYMHEQGEGVESEEARLPKWVVDGLGKRREVVYTSEADEQLRKIVIDDQAKELEFYGKSTGRDDSDEEALDSLKSCITEVLSVDVRSKWQTSKARSGKSRAETAKRVKEIKSDKVQNSEEVKAEVQNVCTQQLDRLLIKFTVKEYVATEDCAVDTRGSGADDVIIVLGIEFMSTKK